MELKAAKEWIFDLIFPKICVGCGWEGSFVCETCAQKLTFSAPTCPVCSRRNFDGILCDSCQEKSGLRRFLAPFSYRDTLVRELIHAYKYEGVRELKTYFAEEMLKFINFYGVRLAREAIFIPIPLHRARERERGFNQARLLAEELGRRLGLKIENLLFRARATERQIEMVSYSKRRENVAGAFKIKDPAACSGRTVILVDDVSTSGATLYEAARALRGAGARTVSAVVIAKG